MGIEYYKLHDKIKSFSKDINFHNGLTGKFEFKKETFTTNNKYS